MFTYVPCMRYTPRQKVVLLNRVSKYGIFYCGVLAISVHILELLDSDFQVQNCQLYISVDTIKLGGLEKVHNLKKYT